MVKTDGYVRMEWNASALGGKCTYRRNGKRKRTLTAHARILSMNTNYYDNGRSEDYIDVE